MKKAQTIQVSFLFVFTHYEHHRTTQQQWTTLGPGKYCYSKFFYLHTTIPLPITVKLHFHEMYNICIQYLDLFGVNISGKNTPHPSIIPAELCQVILGQLYKQRLLNILP